MRLTFSPPPLGERNSFPHSALALVGLFIASNAIGSSIKFTETDGSVEFGTPAADTREIGLLGTIEAEKFTASSITPPGAFGSFIAVEKMPYESIDQNWLRGNIEQGWPEIPFVMRSQHWTIDWGSDTGKIVLLRYRANHFKRGAPPANPEGPFYTYHRWLYPWYLNSLYPGGIREASGIFIGDQITPTTGNRIAGSVHQENRVIFNGQPEHEVWSFEGEDTIRYSDFKGPTEILVQNSMAHCPGHHPTASFEYSLRAVSSCKLLPFTPITDPNALLVEEGQTPVLMQGLTPQLLASYQCLDLAVRAAGGTLTVNSAVRPPQYQNHLYEVRQNKLRLDTLGADTSGCQSILPEVRREWNKHRPGVTGKTSKHSLGKAIDMNWYPENLDIATLSRNCGLRRPLLNWKVMPEPWHFEN